MASRDIAPGPSGPTVLLLHAYPFDHRMWLPTMDHLAGTPVLLVDAPGSGKSESSMNTPSLGACTDQIVARVGRFGVERIIPVSNSMGGYVALTLLERHPDIVTGLGLLGTRAGADSVNAKVRRFENLVTMLAGRREELLTLQVESILTKSTRRARPEIISQAVQWSRNAINGGISWAQRAITSHPNRLDLIAAFHKPVLMVRRENGMVTPPEQTAALAQAAGVDVMGVHDTSRLISIENPGTASHHVMTLYSQCT